ncbi:Ig-like domain-containing protein, partial [Aquibacillus rhizosphaerae]
ETVELTEGESSQLTATVIPDTAVNKAVAWVSSNEEVATVDESGNVTAVKAGTAFITVTTADGGHMATSEVTVEEATDTTPGDDRNELTLGGDSQEVEAGETYTVTGTSAKVTMPADLPVGTKMKVETKNVEETNYDGLVPSGDNLTFTFEFPEGSEAPNSDFSLVMGYDEAVDATSLAIYYYNENAKEWEHRGGDIDEENKTITIAVSHFSTYGVFVETDETPGDGQPGEDGQDGADGEDGQDGSDGEDGQDGADGEDGQDGADGEDGQDGADGEDGQDGADNEGSQAGEDNKDGDATSGKDEKLPNTATNLFNYLLIGMILLVAGGLTALYARKRKMNR